MQYTSTECDSKNAVYEYWVRLYECSIRVLSATLRMQYTRTECDSTSALCSIRALSATQRVQYMSTECDSTSAVYEHWVPLHECSIRAVSATPLVQYTSTQCDSTSAVYEDWVHFVVSSEAQTEVLGGPDVYINTGSSINLTCLVQYTPQPPNFVVWQHNGKVTSPHSHQTSWCGSIMAR